MKPTEEWAAVLARMERWETYAWQPPAQGRPQDVMTWRVASAITLNSGDYPRTAIDLESGTLLQIEAVTWGDDYWHGRVSWQTSRLLVLNGLHAGSIVTHSTFFHDDENGAAMLVRHAFPPAGLEPVESGPVTLALRSRGLR
jgi:hypothetical protein